MAPAIVGGWFTEREPPLREPQTKLLRPIATHGLMFVREHLTRQT